MKNQKLNPCKYCGEIPLVETVVSGDGFASFYMEHYCEKYKDGKSRDVAMDIDMSDDNKFTLIKAWNETIGEKDG